MNWANRNLGHNRYQAQETQLIWAVGWISVLRFSYVSLRERRERERQWEGARWRRLQELEMAAVVRGALKLIKEKGIGGFFREIRNEGYLWVPFKFAWKLLFFLFNFYFYCLFWSNQFVYASHWIVTCSNWFHAYIDRFQWHEFGGFDSILFQ